MGQAISKQKELMPIYEVAGMRSFPESEMRLCRSFRDALRVTCERSGRKRFAIEDETEISSSHLSQVFTGSKHFPLEKLRAYFTACQNVYALQWLAYQLGYRLVEREFSEEERLAAELAHARARLAELERRTA